MAAQNRPRITATTSIILTPPYYWVRLIADPGFWLASSGLENGFVQTADQNPPQPGSGREPCDGRDLWQLETACPEADSPAGFFQSYGGREVIVC